MFDWDEVVLFPVIFLVLFKFNFLLHLYVRILKASYLIFC